MVRRAAKAQGEDISSSRFGQPARQANQVGLRIDGTQQRIAGGLRAVALLIAHRATVGARHLSEQPGTIECLARTRP